MANMNKAGGKLVLWLIIIGMLVFTAIRTIHFLQLTFPPDQQYVAYLGLASFDAGVLGWFYFATQSAEGVMQRVIAYAMIFICAGGVLSTTIVDMTMVSQQNGLATMPKDMGTLGLWAVIIVIALDFLAGILAHLADPAHMKHFEMQNAKDVIHATTMMHIKEQANAIAPQIASQVSAYWATQVAAEMTGQIPGQKQPLQLASPSNVVEGTGTSLPQTTQQPTTQQQQVPGVFGRVKQVFNPQAPVTQPVQQASTPVQPSSHTEDLEQLYKSHPEQFAAIVEMIQRQPQSPLQQPILDTTNGNGHSPK